MTSIGLSMLDRGYILNSINIREWPKKATRAKRENKITELVNEPHRSRTCNLLIKRHDPYLLPGTGYISPVSDIRKHSYDLCLTFYLLLSAVAKLVGKMLVKILRCLAILWRTY